MNKKTENAKKINIKKLKLSKEVYFKRNIYSGGCGYTDFSCTNVR